MNSYQRLAAAILATVPVFLFSTISIANEIGDLDGEALIITSGDPGSPQFANAGDNLRNGVGSLFIEFNGIPTGGFICTASAIGDRHILTAAHCVIEPGDTVRRIRFIVSAGREIPLIIDASGFAVHPWYELFLPFYGAFSHGDIAVIELATPLPPEVERYDLYRDTDEFGQEARHYGHGRSGKGTKGATGGTDFFYARTGLNQYESTMAPLLGDGINDQLVHDFDSGGRKHNAMEWWLTSSFACHPRNPNVPDQAQAGQCTTFKDGSYPDFKGFGKLEIGIAPGDSGGPGFIDGKIAGVHSFGFTHFCEGVTNGTDFTCGLDSSYGEMSGDTSVSFHQLFVDLAMDGTLPMTGVPQAVAPAASATTEQAAELSANGKSFVENVFSRRMRAKVVPGTE